MIVQTQVDDLDIGWRWFDLRSVSDTVIQQLVMSMKRLEISCWGLTEDQRVVLFNSISQSPQLVTLKLHHAYYPDLSKLFNHLLVTDQPRLKHLTLVWSYLYKYDPATLAHSLSKLESVDMTDSFAPPALLPMLAEKIKSGSSNLKDFHFSKK